MIAKATLLELAKDDVSPSKKLKVNDAGELFQPNIDASMEMKQLTEDLVLKHLLCLPPKKKGPSIDIFVDATFGCCPHPFEQCLIIMVHDHHTSAYVPVLYILMTNKFESQYEQAFFQVRMLSEGKINVRTYTSDFEQGLMNGLDKMFGSKYGHSGTHIGCFFRLKQAWQKYLIESVKMPSPEIVKDATKIGCLDILFIIP